jgi:mRNA-degrading endonuclease RelE of RelBE toxin-antitoxin system
MLMNLTEDMGYKILFSSNVDKFLKKLSKKNKKDLKIIREAIVSILQDPYDSKMLKGTFKDYRRIRKDPYRIIFKIKKNKNSKNEILILKIAKRSNIYK